MILNKQKVNTAAEENSKISAYKSDFPHHYYSEFSGFKAGVAYAEKEMESLAVEYLDWCINNSMEVVNNYNKKHKLFSKFLKQRDE
jgi:hypothetical protein